MNNKYEIRGDVTAIFLSQKDGSVLETLIDTKSLDMLLDMDGTWSAQWNPCVKSYYVVKWDGKGRKNRKLLYLHRVVTECPEGLEPDHLNHDTLDNRTINLKVGTHADNVKNCRKPKHINIKANGFIYWHKGKGYWVGRIKKHGKIMYQKCNKDKSVVQSALEKYKEMFLDEINKVN